MNFIEAFNQLNEQYHQRDGWWMRRRSWEYYEGLMQGINRNLWWKLRGEFKTSCRSYLILPKDVNADDWEVEEINTTTGFNRIQGN